MKNTYKKHLLLQGNSLSPTASENYPAKSKLTHFSEHSRLKTCCFKSARKTTWEI
jgi:hypothetical protein